MLLHPDVARRIAVAVAYVLKISRPAISCAQPRLKSRLDRMANSPVRRNNLIFFESYERPCPFTQMRSFVSAEREISFLFIPAS